MAESVAALQPGGLGEDEYLKQFLREIIDAGGSYDLDNDTYKDPLVCHDLGVVELPIDNIRRRKTCSKCAGRNLTWRVVERGHVGTRYTCADSITWTDDHESDLIPRDAFVHMRLRTGHHHYHYYDRSRHVLSLGPFDCSLPAFIHKILSDVYHNIELRVEGEPIWNPIDLPAPLVNWLPWTTLQVRSVIYGYLDFINGKRTLHWGTRASVFRQLAGNRVYRLPYTLSKDLSDIIRGYIVFPYRIFKSDFILQ